LKGGETIGGVHKKKKKKSASKSQANVSEEGGKEAEGPATTSQAAYEKEFEFEEQRRKEGKVKTTPWGSSYRAAPEILHGYDRRVQGDTAEERLDMRCATKADKFCK